MKSTGPAKTQNTTQDDMAETLDQLAEFEEFKRVVLPSLQKDLAVGMSAKDILKKYSPVAAARIVSTVALEPDSSKALAAAKDIIDRADGKAKESVQHTHVYENLNDSELDAQMLSRAEEVGMRALAKSEKKTDTTKH